MRKIRVTLLPDGTQRIEVLGATGDECVAFTRSLERRLGHVVGERTMKPEYAELPPEPEAEGVERAQREGGR